MSTPGSASHSAEVSVFAPLGSLLCDQKSVISHERGWNSCLDNLERALST